MAGGSWLATTKRWRRGADLPLLATRLLFGSAVMLGVYVAAQLGEARHASLVAGTVGLLLALAVAANVRAPIRLRALPGFAAAASARLRLLFPAAAVLAALVLAPVLSTKLLPFDDYTNHLARIYVITNSGHDPLLDRFYAIHWILAPNLAIDLLAPWLVKATNIYLGGRLFVALYMLLLLSGPHAIQFALYRRLSVGPLVASLFIYSAIGKYGVANYEFGVGLAMWSIAGWILLRRSRLLLRAAYALTCVLVLFFCHLMALAVYGLAIGSFELWSLLTASRPRDARMLAEAAVLVLPFVVAIALLSLGPKDDAAFAIPPVWGGLHARIDGIRYIFQAYYPRLDLIAMVAMAMGLAWAWRQRMLRIHPFAWIFLALSAAVYLVMPNVAMGSWGAAVRVPVAELFVVIGALQWSFVSSRARFGFLAAVAAIAAFRIATVDVAFRHYDRIRQQLEASLQLVPPGSRILVADEYEHSVLSLIAIRELPCLAIIERSSLVSLEYSHPLQQVLVVRPPFREIAGGFSDQPVPLADLLHPPQVQSPATAPFYAPSGRVYWADWPHTYDYVYVMDRENAPSPDPARLDLIYSGERFQLLRVRHP